MSHFHVEFKEYNSLEELPRAEQQLCEAAKTVCNDAYAPYSGFHVGAAVQMANGEVYTGNNQENSAFPSGLCAERVAVFGASSHFPGIAIKAVAVFAKSQEHEVEEPVSPCGACRQVMVEYEIRQRKPVRVIMLHQSGKVRVADRAGDLLPFAFRGSFLG